METIQSHKIFFVFNKNLLTMIILYDSISLDELP